jgi:hypothetical protein
LEAGSVTATRHQGGRRMKLHGNAALSLNQRRGLARRVIEEGWSLAGAAKCRRGERGDCRQVGRPLPNGGRAGAPRSTLDPARDPSSHPQGPRPGDRLAQAAALHRARDRRSAGAGHLDRLRGAEADRPRQALAPGAARADRSLREAARRRALAHRRQEAGSDRAPQGRAIESPGSGCAAIRRGPTGSGVRRL